MGKKLVKTMFRPLPFTEDMICINDLLITLFDVSYLMNVRFQSISRNEKVN